MSIPKIVSRDKVLYSPPNIKIGANPKYPRPKTGKSGVAKAKRAAKQR